MRRRVLGTLWDGTGGRVSREEETGSGVVSRVDGVRVGPE